MSAELDTDYTMPLFTRCGCEIFVEDLILEARDLDLNSKPFKKTKARRRNHEAGVIARINGASLRECGLIWDCSATRATQILAKIKRKAVERALEPSRFGKTFVAVRS